MNVFMSLVSSVLLTGGLLLGALIGGDESSQLVPTATPSITETEVFNVTNAAGYRHITIPDLGSFEYPLAFYSVHTLSASNAYNGGEDIWFPGIIHIEPNDSVIYGVQFDTAYRIQIAMTEAEGELDASLLGTGPLVQYDTDMYEVGDIVQLSLNGIPALRIDNLPIGPAGEVTSDIILVYEGRLIEILVEPVGEVGGSVIEGKYIVDGIISSLTFD